jgi:hypothetical protein
MGLGVGVAASSAAAVWLYEHPNTSAPAWRHAADATAQGTPQDLETLGAEVARLKGETESDLTALRSRLARVDRDQESSSQSLNQIAEKLSRAGLDGSTVPAARDDKADGATLTPEEERERATARTQAEIDLLEGTLRAEKSDPAWATAAQLALHTTLHKEALPRVQLMKAECRTTLCRMELALDGSTAQESFRNLIDLAPWSGQGLIQLNAETGLAVMYLAREEHTLPQVTE